jgi:hypothetical protein
MPSQERILAANIAACRVIEDDENIYSRQQRQIDLLVAEIILLIQKVRDLENG